MKHFTLLAAAVLALCFGLKAQTNVSALITSNQVWTLSGSPYIIGQNTYVDTGVSIIVMPGVEIKTTGLYNIAINGEFQARGKRDSIIKISNLELVFTKNSKDYNFSTGRGAYFNYCNIVGNGSGYRTINATTTGMKIENCEFSNSYFTLYMQSSYPYDTIVTDVSNCKFRGDMYGYGYAIYGNIMQSKLTVTNCYFTQTGYIYTYGNVTYKNNVFYKVRKINSDYLFGTSEFSCNRFIRMDEGLSINLSGLYTKGKLIFKYNTLDSIGSVNTPNYSNFVLTRPMSTYPQFGPVEIHNNNFLTNLSTAAKVSIAGSNQNPLKTDSIDFKDNYWGSNDSATIASYIKDYNDDVNIYGRVDFRNYKSSPVIGCSYNPSCNKANFEYSISDSVVTFTDKSYGSKPYKVRWVFGDGTSDNSNNKAPVHGYKNAGIYIACLYVYDTLENICDSMCKQIEIKSKGRCEAGYYFAVDSSDRMNVYIVNTSTGTNTKTKYYWTFGDGSGSNAKNPVHTFSSPGKYGICLTIFDTLVNCYSTYCDSVSLDTNGIILFVIDSKDLSLINKQGFISVVNVYPNPSAGNISISLQALRSGNVQIDVMNSNGQIVRSSSFETVSGSNVTELDLSEFDSGLYCVRVQSGDFSKTIKFILKK